MPSGGGAEAEGVSAGGPKILNRERPGRSATPYLSKVTPGVHTLPCELVLDDHVQSRLNRTSSSRLYRGERGVSPGLGRVMRDRLS